MTGRMSDLFDPERLRGRWGDGKAEAAAEGGADETPGVPPAALEALDRLRAAIAAELGARALPAEPLLERAREVIAREQKEGEEGSAPLAGKALAESRKALRAILDDLEDLIDAMRLGKPERAKAEAEEAGEGEAEGGALEKIEEAAGLLEEVPVEDVAGFFGGEGGESGLKGEGGGVDLGGPAGGEGGAGGRVGGEGGE
jgi:hypothetical protein